MWWNVQASEQCRFSHLTLGTKSIQCISQTMCVFVGVHPHVIIASQCLSAYVELLVVLVLDALKSVFFGASLAYFEETGAPVGSERQLLQHDVLGHAHFLPKIHLHIWTQGDKQKTKELVNWSNFWQDKFPILPPIKPHWTQIIFTQREKKAIYMDCWLGIPANMMNEELSSLVIHPCTVLVLWLAPRASYCMLIMEMSQA